MMMSYEEFKNKLQEQIVEYLEEGCTFRLCVVHKPNRDMEALSVAKPSNPEIGVNIYLDDLYEDYFCGQVDFNDILKDVADMVNRENVSNVISLDNIFDDVRNTVFPCVVNTEKNKEFLETVPHRAFLDLSVIYKKPVKSVDDAVVTITNTMLERIGMTEEELYNAAVKNMIAVNGVMVADMASILDGLEDGKERAFYSEEDIERIELPLLDTCYGAIPLYCVSNGPRVSGSSVFLLKAFWKKVSDVLGESILPSSIHELLFMKESDCMDVGYLKDMIREVNMTQVRPEEFLSDNLYYYDKDTGVIFDVV